MTFLSSKELPKPKIVRGVHSPWKCVSGEYGYPGSAAGRRVVGVGDTPNEAYDDWLTVYREMERNNV